MAKTVTHVLRNMWTKTCELFTWQHVYAPCPAMFIRHGVFLHDGCEAEQRELLQQAELAR